MSACNKPKRRNLVRSKNVTTISLKLWSIAYHHPRILPVCGIQILGHAWAIAQLRPGEEYAVASNESTTFFHAFRRAAKPHLSNVALIRPNRFRLSLKVCLGRSMNALKASQPSGAVLEATSLPLSLQLRSIRV